MSFELFNTNCCLNHSWQFPNKCWMQRTWTYFSFLHWWLLWLWESCCITTCSKICRIHTSPSYGPPSAAPYPGMYPPNQHLPFPQQPPYMLSHLHSWPSSSEVSYTRHLYSCAAIAKRVQSRETNMHSYLLWHLPLCYTCIANPQWLKLYVCVYL